MGKTVQTISCILSNRPKLQHQPFSASSVGLGSVKKSSNAPVSLCITIDTPPEASSSAKVNSTTPPSPASEKQMWAIARNEWEEEFRIQKILDALRPKGGPQKAGTLVVCPLVALSQWRSEIEKFTASHSLSVLTYHGASRDKISASMVAKYDVVLTTYQTIEADARKMTNPNKVSCPNCGRRFQPNKLFIHLKYFCGEDAERTEAQARQVRGGGWGGQGGKGGSGSFGYNGGTGTDPGSNGTAVNGRVAGTGGLEHKTQSGARGGGGGGGASAIGAGGNGSSGSHDCRSLDLDCLLYCIPAATI